MQLRSESRVARTIAWSIGVGLALTILAGVRTTDTRAESAARLCDSSSASRIPQPTARHLAAAGLARLPIAPKRKRVDLVARPFSNSTSITNPLFPISKLRSAILNGRVSGKVFRVETTLLPDTRIVEWRKGQCVRTLVSQ